MTSPRPGRPRVLVTRAAEDAGPLAAALDDAGLVPVRVPLIARSVDVEAVRAGLAAHPHPDVLLLTSPATVAAMDGAIPAGFAPQRVVCVGPATADAARDQGLSVDVVPDAHTGADAVRAAGDLTRRTVLYVHGRKTVAATREALDASGAVVVDVVAYVTRVRSDAAEALTAAGPADLVTLTSPSLARAYAAAAHAPVPAVVIGPTTAQAARHAGLVVAGVADPHTLDGLVAATVRAAR